MNPINEPTLQSAAEVLAPWAKATEAQGDDRLFVTIAAADLLPAVEALFQEARWGYLATITGVDLGVEAGQFEVLYHFCAGALVTTLRVPIPRSAPVVPTLYHLIPSVTFYERELIEMFGITVQGTPNTERLFLPDDWPAGVYPLRKDFSLDDLAAPGSTVRPGGA